MYTATMILLLIKGRFWNIGIDNSKQFEPVYMSMLADKIISYIDFDMNQYKRTFMKTEKYYIDKVRIVYVNGMPIKIKLNREVFDKIF